MFGLAGGIPATQPTAKYNELDTHTAALVDSYCKFWTARISIGESRDARLQV